MAHTALVPQPLEKNDKKHDYNTINKKFGTTLASTESSPTTSKASPTNTPDRLTHKTSSMHHYVSQQAKNICVIRNVGSNIVQRKA